MIENFDFHELPGADQVAGHLDVGFARRWIAAGMIVHKHNRRGVRGNGVFKDFTSAHKHAVEGSLGNLPHTDQSAAGVKKQHVEMFDIMKPVLLSATKPDAYTIDLLGPPNSGTSPIRALLKTSPSGTYLIAVNIINDNLEAVIQLSTTVTSTVVQFENRTVATPLSAIRDTFGPFAVHIYKY